MDCLFVIADDPDSYVHGVVTREGIFEGKIVTTDDQYVIERTGRYFEANTQPFHSVIYRHSDVHMETLVPSLCMSDHLHARMHRLQLNDTLHQRHQRFVQGHKARLKRGARFQKKSRPADAYSQKALAHVAPPKDSRSRFSHHQRKRAIDPSKTTCTLYMQADHLFYEKYHSNTETVIEQLTQHVQGVNQIYSAIGESKRGE